jgi:hypothetical protein
MGKNLAISGHPTRSKEVVELLRMLGGKDSNDHKCSNPNRFYQVLNGHICWGYIGLEEFVEYDIFTLEEFLDKYPFKVGDKVFDIADGNPGMIGSMKWDEDVSDMKYHVFFDNGDMGWYTNDTIGFLKKDENLEETQSSHDKSIFIMEHSMWPIVKDGFLEYKIVDGYEVDKIENGNIILKPIKPKYPKNYEECCGVLGMTYDYPDIKMVSIDECSLYSSFIELKRCRDAYWKIAGEEMGLDKPWEPDWESYKDNFCIITYKNKPIRYEIQYRNRILAFPTEEMRDAFYENFGDLIENCKELL